MKITAVDVFYLSMPEVRDNGDGSVPRTSNNGDQSYGVRSLPTTFGRVIYQVTA